MNERCWENIYAAILVLQYFFNGTSLSVLFSFFPSEAIQKGFTETTLGLLFALYAVCKILFNFLAPRIIAATSVKRTLIVGFILCGVSRTLFACLILLPAGWSFILLSCLLRAVEASGFGVAGVSMYTTCLQLFKERNYVITSLAFSAQLCGNAIGPSIGGLLYAAGGFITPFLIMGLAQLFFTICLWRILPEITNDAPDSEPPYGKILKNPIGLASPITTLVASLTSGFYEATFSLYLNFQFQLNSASVGLCYLLYGIVSPLMSVISSNLLRYCKALHPFMFICSGMLTLGFGFQVIGSAIPSLPVSVQTTLAGAAILGIGHGSSMFPSFMSLDRVAVETAELPANPSTRSTVVAIFEMSRNLGLLLGSLIGGALNDPEHLGFRAGSSIFGLLPFTWFILVVTLLIIMRCRGIPVYGKPEDEERRCIIDKSADDDL